MKEWLSQMAVYTGWANQQLADFILSLPPELSTQETPSSFNTLQKTLLHMWDAQSIWWQRMKLQESVVPPSVNFKGTTRDAVAGLLHQNKLWENWVLTASPAMMDHVILYYNSKREPIKIRIDQLLLHSFNHDTYHRGQLVTMLRQLGVQKIPGTDYFIWSRKNVK